MAAITIWGRFSHTHVCVWLCVCQTHEVDQNKLANAHTHTHLFKSVDRACANYC